MNLNFLRNKSILITGGTGSFGENFIEFLLKKSKNFGKPIINKKTGANRITKNEPKY